jgi:hypothetical protein
MTGKNEIVMHNRLKAAVKEANRPTIIASDFANDFFLVKL